MKNSEFQKAYLQIIAEENIITQGFFSNIKNAVKQKFTGDANDLYFKSGKGNANDLWLTAVKFQQLCGKLGFKDVPSAPFRQLMQYFKNQKGYSKKAVQSAVLTSAEKVNNQIVNTDKQICKTVLDFKDNITNEIKTVYKAATDNFILIIEYIVSAFKFAKDKVIEFFYQALDAQKKLAKKVYNKIKNLISELAAIEVSIIKFHVDVALKITKILGSIALASIGIIFIVGEKIVEQQKQIFNIAVAKGQEVVKAGKNVASTISKEIKTDIKTIGKLSSAIAAAREQASKQVAAQA